MTLVCQPTNQGKVIWSVSIVLIWFLLVLGGSVLGSFAQVPVVFYVIVGGPVVLFVVGYVVSNPFRRFTRSLVGEPWGITLIQVYRVLGSAMAIAAFRQIVPPLFGLPAGFGDLFIGVTAPLAAAGWVSGTRWGKVVFVLWNVLGLLDLFIALGTGLLAVVTHAGPGTMAAMRLYPLSLVPGFGVPLAFILHFTGLAQYWYVSRSEARPSAPPQLASNNCSHGHEQGGHPYDR
jgi:hypothetical protein